MRGARVLFILKVLSLYQLLWTLGLFTSSNPALGAAMGPPPGPAAAAPSAEQSSACNPAVAEQDCAPNPQTLSAVNDSCSSLPSQLSQLMSFGMVSSMGGGGGRGLGGFSCPDLGISLASGADSQMADVPCPSAMMGASMNMGMGQGMMGMGMGGMGMGMGGMGMGMGMPGMGMGMGMPGMGMGMGMPGMGMGMGMGGMGMGAVGGGSCAMFPPGSNPRSSPAFQHEIQMMNMQICGAMCQKGKIDTLLQKVKCVSAQSNLFTQKVGCAQQFYTKCLTEKNLQLQQKREDRLDTTARLEFTNKRLTGNPNGDVGSPAPGSLMELKARTEETLAKMPGEITQIQQANVEADRALQGAQQYKKMAIGSRMMGCFNTFTKASDTCTQTSGAVNAKEAVLCHYRQQLYLGARGEIRRDQTTRRQAEVKAERLGTLLDQIFKDAPEIAAVPTTPEEIAKFANQTQQITTADDVKVRYASALRGYNLGAQTAWDFIETRLKFCQRRETIAMDKQEDTQGSTLKTMINRVEDKKRENQALVEGLLNKYNSQYSENVSGLSGKQASLNTASCKNRPPAAQVNCLKQIQTKMEGLLSGTGKDSQMEMVIQGTIPANDGINRFKCNGLRGCITKMQNMARALDTRGKRQDSEKAAFVAKTNIQIDAYTKQKAKELAPANAMLTQKLHQLQASAGALAASMPMMGGMMGGMGMGGGSLATATVKPEAFQYDDEPPLPKGLIKQPQSVASAIGQYMNPPMIDVNGTDIGEMVAKLGPASMMVQNQLGMAMMMRTQLEALPATCAAQNQMGQADALANQLGQIQGANCSHYYGSTQKCVDQHKGLMQTVNKMGPGSLDPNVFDNLQTGINGLCPPMMPLQTGQAAPISSPAHCMSINSLQGKVLRLQSSGMGGAYGVGRVR